MLNMLLGPAVDLAKDFIKGKAEEKKAIQERKINMIQNDADWENKMADATANSWKDEFWLVIDLHYRVIAKQPFKVIAKP